MLHSNATHLNESCSIIQIFVFIFMIKSQGWYSLSAKRKKEKKLSNVTTENGLKQLTKTFEQPKRESKPSMNFKIQEEKKKHYFSTLQVLIKKITIHSPLCHENYLH
ncbi:hypothetical protein ACB098_11G169500 [Castanea mollissima]